MNRNSTLLVPFKQIVATLSVETVTECRMTEKERPNIE
jgi:hypothetical protein